MEPETRPVTVKAFERCYRKNPTQMDEGEKARFSEDVPVDEVVLLPKEVEGLPEDAYVHLRAPKLWKECFGDSGKDAA